MTIKKLSKEMDGRLSASRNYRLAYQHMGEYLDSITEEQKYRRENAVLIDKIDEMIGVMQEMQKELRDLKAQNDVFADRIHFMGYPRLTIDIGERQDIPLDNDVSALWRQAAYVTAPAKPPLVMWEPADGEVPSPPAAESVPQAQELPREAPVPQSRKREEPGKGIYKLSEDDHFREMFSADRSGQERDSSIPKPPDIPPPTVPPETPPKQEPIVKPAPIVKQEPAPQQEPEEAVAKGKKVRKAEPKKRASAFSVAANILFYLCMVLLIVGAVSFAQSQDSNKSLMGFRYYYIKTASMIPVYPVGSVVITKVTDPATIQVGDDITVYVGDGKNDTYLTHRVVEITKDDAGELAFRTKGVNNKSNDPAPFNGKLVVGKVVFCIPMLGTVMMFVRSQLWLVIGIFILLLVLSFMLKLMFSKEETEDSGQETENSPGPGETGKKGNKKPQGRNAKKKQDESQNQQE